MASSLFEAPTDFHLMTLDQLRGEAKKRGLDTFGEYTHLYRRLREREYWSFGFYRWSLQDLKTALLGRGVKRYGTSPPIMHISTKLTHFTSHHISNAFFSKEITLYSHIQQLKLIEQTATFTRFFELPAELRNEVYKYICAPRSRMRDRVVLTPAICCASRQLCNESLPVFLALIRRKTSGPV